MSTEPWRVLDVMRELVHQHDLAERITELALLPPEHVDGKWLAEAIHDRDENSALAWEQAKAILAGSDDPEAQPYDDELHGLSAIVTRLAMLDGPSRKRVVRYLVERTNDPKAWPSDG